jgi:hypothetical protein
VKQNPNRVTITEEIAPEKGASALPAFINTEAELDELLTRPRDALVEFIKTVSTPLLVLGAGGKMGPTLAILAHRAARKANHPLKVIAVSRFGDKLARAHLEAEGVRTIACDLLEEKSLSCLPDSENVICLVGQKFGTHENPSATWAINTIVPARIAERYSNARIVAVSTGNVYPLTEVDRGGSVESDPLRPLGEYANATVGRERVFEFYSLRNRNPLALLRLYYAVDLRYGVVVDIARKIYADHSVELANGCFNCIWQGDANDMILRALSLADSPPIARNLCLPEVFQVRQIATRLGELLERPVSFHGTEATTALLGKATRICAELGEPQIGIETMLRWTAHWVKNDGRNLNRPTHFEVRDGKY